APQLLLTENDLRASRPVRVRGRRDRDGSLLPYAVQCLGHGTAPRRHAGTDRRRALACASGLGCTEGRGVGGPAGHHVRGSPKAGPFRLMERAKAEAVSHWAARPCGAEAGRDLREGSPEFFESVDRGRYEEYAPWLPKLVRF